MGLTEAARQLASLEARFGQRASGLTVQRDGELARVVLHDQRVRNALGLASLRCFAEGLAELHAAPPKLLVLRASEPGAFCAGGNLPEVRALCASREASAEFAAAATAVLDGLASLPAVTLALVEGAAVGGGAELLQAVDVRVGAPAAVVHFAQAELGIATGWGGAARLKARVGHAGAVEALLGTRRFDATQALARGLLDALVADGAGLDAEEARWRACLSGVPAQAVVACKRQLMGDAGHEAFLEVWGSPVHLAAIAPKLGR